ncbi:MAG: hypothetical protein ACPGU7_08650 [Gammaproteobacteria bacterium]
MPNTSVLYFLTGVIVLGLAVVLSMESGLEAEPALALSLGMGGAGVVWVLAALAVSGARAPRPFGRFTWLVLGLSGGVILGAVLFILGPDSFHGRLIEQMPKRFVVLYGLPALMVAAGFVALLPRVLRLNILLLLILLALVETGLHFIPTPTAVTQTLTTDSGGPAYTDDPHVGYLLAPDATFVHRSATAQEVIFEREYHSDHQGRRVTSAAVSSLSDRPRPVLLFGGSNTFGHGLEDADTLSALIEANAPPGALHGLNYGVSGWGPVQTMDRLRTRDPSTEVNGRPVAAFYFYVPGHLDRVTGAGRVSSGVWGASFSAYRLNGDGEPERVGVLGEQFRSGIDRILEMSRLGTLLRDKVAWPLWKPDFTLMARVFTRIDQHLADAWPDAGAAPRLCVVALPRAREHVAVMSGELAEAGVAFLDLSRVYDPADPRFQLHPRDHHNSAAANQRIALELAARLDAVTADQPCGAVVGDAPAQGPKHGARAPVMTGISDPDPAIESAPGPGV